MITIPLQANDDLAGSGNNTTTTNIISSGNGNFTLSLSLVGGDASDDAISMVRLRTSNSLSGITDFVVIES